MNGLYFAAELPENDTSLGSIGLSIEPGRPNLNIAGLRVIYDAQICQNRHAIRQVKIHLGYWTPTVISRKGRIKLVVVGNCLRVRRGRRFRESPESNIINGTAL